MMGESKTVQINLEKKVSYFLGGLYDRDAYDVREFGVRSFGQFDLDNHGGPSTWVITESPLDASMEASFCVPYGGQKHMYVYTFYDCEDADLKGEDRKKIPLWELLEHHAKMADIKRGNERTFIALSDKNFDLSAMAATNFDFTKLKYDHSVRGIIDTTDEWKEIAEQIIEWNELGGMIDHIFLPDGKALDPDPEQIKKGDIVRIEGDLHSFNRYVVKNIKGNRITCKCIYGAQYETEESFDHLIITEKNEEDLLNKYRQTMSG